MGKRSNLLSAHASAFQYVAQLAHELVGKEACLTALDLENETAWARWRTGRQIPSEDKARRLFKFVWRQADFLDALRAGPDELVSDALLLQEALDPEIAREATAIIDLARQDLDDFKSAIDGVKRRVPEILGPLLAKIQKIEDWIAMYDSDDCFTLSEVMESAANNLYIRDVMRNSHGYSESDQTEQESESLKFTKVKFLQPPVGGVGAVLPFVGKKRRVTKKS